MTGKLRALAGLAGTIVLTAGMASGSAIAFKDQGPKSTACDGLAKTSAAWKACAGDAHAAASDTELFYAGYWLARTGSYADALEYLNRAKAPDERILTYIGFATRKLGRTDEAMGFYNRALTMNPNYSVARAYMGEGFLAKGEPAKAKEQLGEIAQRCGKSCAEYADLAEHIDRFEHGLPPRG